MNQIITLKAQAANLVAAMAEMGVKLTKSQGLEAIAKQYGVANWDTLNGMLKAKKTIPAPRLADMPGYPDQVIVEQGPKSTYYSVGSYDEEGLALLHDLPALQAHFAKYAELYPEGMDALAIELYGDGHDLRFTFQQLVSLEYRILGGRGTWKLANEDTYLTFICGTTWTPPEGGVAEPVQLPAIPQTVKSVKGVKVLKMTSIESSTYDKFFLVPPHVDIEVVKKKLDEEVERLKTEDSDGLDNGNYLRYQGLDIADFAKGLGLEQVKPETCSENWDC